MLNLLTPPRPLQKCHLSFYMQNVKIIFYYMTFDLQNSAKGDIVLRWY